ncbi:HpcH/HpaI aldolase/citrate lyase family protein [Rubellimicrobium arenae]|uniref:HpcH/HpaI aldolase/citrate lyase family protein n=1 Tax=Rubellimicrobium arenae TaxID=2817372 RepID=UPI001B317E7B|nr:CoA ester lyase [Rubellimicrobium arenae]
MTRLATARSFLFVPADRPERFAKAHASGADIVVVDLEDAVAPAAKVPAREALAQRLDPGRPVVVRVNAPGTEWHDADLTLAGRPGVAALMLPKAERADDIARCPGPVIPQVETARGMAALEQLAAAPRVVRLALGTLDLALDLGIPAEGTAMDLFRAQMTLASRVAGLAPPIDGVTTSFDDEAPVESDTRRALAFGFGARLCIHPRQIGPVHRAMRPSDEELAWARDVVDLADREARGAVNLRGTMVDPPVVERARRLLARG